MKQFASKEEENNIMNMKQVKLIFLLGIKSKNGQSMISLLLTVDIVLMCYNKEEDQLKILLIQRKGHPYRNSWALPGGFVQKMSLQEKVYYEKPKKKLA